MHLVARIAPELAWRMNDVQISDCARAAGLALPALSSYCTGPARQQGLLMGYSGFQDEELEAACQRLANALQA
jgi:GntR family transcriptional regulator/MocR family aminotransferase